MMFCITKFIIPRNLECVNKNNSTFRAKRGKMEIINKIIEIMKKKDITPYRMEKDIGIKQTTFISWKKGSQPPADKLIKIIQYLKVSPNELFGYEAVINLSQNDKEMLELFQKLPERDQIKYIARLEDAVKELPKEKSLDSKIG